MEFLGIKKKENPAARKKESSSGKEGAFSLLGKQVLQRKGDQGKSKGEGGAKKGQGASTFAQQERQPTTARPDKEKAILPGHVRRS